MTRKRQDVHRPSFADPSEYTEVGFVDNHPEFGSAYRDHDVIGDASEFHGNYTTRGRCDHCGAGPLRFAIEFLHAPSNQTVMVGFACAGKLNLSSRSEVEIRKILEQKARERAVDEWTNQAEVNAEIRAFLAEVANTPYVQVEDGYDERDDQAPVVYPFKAKFPAIQGGTVAFLDDLNHKLNRYGNLTENQVAAVVKIKARNDERLAAYAARSEELAEVAPLAEGRREITGTIVSTKLVDGFGGDTVLKMLVEEADGNRVYGTVPAILADPATFGDWNDETQQYDKLELKGLKITFKAQVERSQKDEHFGFFKRPTGTQVVEEVAA
jgi:hypothetical protein